ncbi:MULTISPECIES: ribosomal subunit interface protein [Actinosynnema]|uniref:Ribosomal subunit interface protein n=1 Tax=Actinosynnema pretiosum TaxID=42197 RepID=A0A290ZAK0_9PSEU|nr:ribosomal subunit interface protein [Actinosynnema pretiosum]ATE56003.1 ribosomal subunit interface protein [Actinosynnema pretiosum]
MQVQVNIDRSVQGGEKLTEFATSELETSLARFDGWVTRVEVHFTEETAAKGEDLRCAIEARPSGAQPVVVSHHASTAGEACVMAVKKLHKALDTRYSKAHDHKGADSIRHQDVGEPLDEVAEELTGEPLAK